MSSMENKKTFLSIVVGLLVAAGVIVWLFYSGQVPVEEEKPTERVNAIVKNTVLQREQDGKKLWQFHVDEVQHLDNGKRLLLKGIEGKVFRKDGSVMDVKADGGSAQLQQNDFSLQGRVTAVLSTGGTLKADRVDYKQNLGLLQAKGHVDIVKDDWRATGDEAETTTEFKHLKMRGKAKVEKGAVQ